MLIGMARSTRAADEFDSPWKDVLQAFLPAFLEFFFPDIHADIDWRRGYQSLDKEFQKIARRAKVGKQFVDKLFKVWLKNGGEHWLLVHIEVQGDAEKEFPERMFNYNAAVRQLYNKEVVSLAILCDDQPNWRPTTFAHGRWGCKMELTFRIAKLLDFAGDVDALEATDNPFGAVVLAHCKTLETRKNPESRKQWKLRVVKGLFRRGWSKDDIEQLFRVIDWMMHLPESLATTFDEEVEELEEKTMRYVTSIERIRLKKAEDEGTRIGSRKVAIESIALDLDDKFGKAGRKLLREIRVVEDVDVLRRLMRLVKKADSLEKIEAFLKRQQAPASESTT
jgi:hypothetical protein